MRLTMDKLDSLGMIHSIAVGRCGNGERMKHITRILILAGSLAIAACASQAPATSAGTGASGQAPPSASSHSKGAPSGYYRKVIDGQEVFCQNGPDLGSRVQRSEKCLTREQLDDEQRNSHNVMQDIQRSGVR